MTRRHDRNRGPPPSAATHIQMPKWNRPLSSGVEFVHQFHAARQHTSRIVNANVEAPKLHGSRARPLGIHSHPGGDAQPVLALAKPDRAPSVPVLYGLLDKVGYIPENVQRVTRSMAPGPIPCHDLSRVDMHHPPAIPM